MAGGLHGPLTCLVPLAAIVMIPLLPTTTQEKIFLFLVQKEGNWISARLSSLLKAPVSKYVWFQTYTCLAPELILFFPVRVKVAVHLSRPTASMLSTPTCSLEPQQEMQTGRSDVLEEFWGPCQRLERLWIQVFSQWEKTADHEEPLRYEFAGAAWTQDHKRSSLNNRNLWSHSAGGRKSKIKVLAGLVPSRGSGWICSLTLSQLPAIDWQPLASLANRSIALLSALVFT